MMRPEGKRYLIDGSFMTEMAAYYYARSQNEHQAVAAIAAANSLQYKGEMVNPPKSLKISNARWHAMISHVERNGDPRR